MIRRLWYEGYNPETTQRYRVNCSDFSRGETLFAITVLQDGKSSTLFAERIPNESEQYELAGRWILGFIASGYYEDPVCCAFGFVEEQGALS